MRVRFTIAEEILDIGDRPHQPQVPGFEVRVSGSIDADRLRDAVAAAVVPHPMARAWKATNRRLARPPEWEIADASAIDFGPVVESVESASDAEMAGIRSRFYSTPITLKRAPAVRLLVVRRAGGDSLCVKWHHAIADGIGGLRLLQSIARAYADEPDPAPVVDALTARSSAHASRQAAPATARATDRRDWIGDPTTLVAPEPDRVEHGYGVHHLTVPAGLIDLRHARSDVESVSLNDVFIAVLHRSIEAWNASHGRPSGRVIVMVPGNKRPARWLHDVVANVVRLDTVTTTAEQRAGRVALLETVVDQTRDLKRRGGGDARRTGWRRRLAPVLLLLATVPAISRRRQAAALLSTMGRIKRVPDFGPAGSVVEFWGFTPIPMPPGLGVGIIGLGDTHHVAFCYRRSLFSPEACERFAGVFLREMLAIAGRQPAEAHADGARRATVAASTT